VEHVLIGALALAVHGYPRATEDVDLGTYVDPFTTLRDVHTRLQRDGLTATLVLPDSEDPPGGVITVVADDHDPIQLVNFRNPLSSVPSPGAEAVRHGVEGLVEGTSFRVVDLPHLVALKLYAGGLDAERDVVELLERNPDVALDDIRVVCERFGLGAALVQAAARTSRG